MSDQTATPAEGYHIHHLEDLKSVDEFCQARGTVLLSIVHVLVSRCQTFFPVYEEVCHQVMISSSLCGILTANAGARSPHPS
jgi:hypothetical protein